MALGLRNIAAFKKKYPEHTIAYDLLIIAGLSKQYRDLLKILDGYELDSRQVANIMRVSIYHASTVLKNLYNLGLVDRRMIVDGEGRRFLWRKKA